MAIGTSHRNSAPTRELRPNMNSSSVRVCSGPWATRRARRVAGLRSALRREAGQHLLEASAQDLRHPRLVDHELDHEGRVAHLEQGLRDWREDSVRSQSVSDQRITLEAD